MDETKVSDYKYVWQNAWGGATGSVNPPQIHSKIKELRRLIGGLEAKKAQYGPSFPVKSAKELEQKLQPALDELDLVMTAEYDVYPVDIHSIPITQNRKGEEVVVRSAVSVRCRVRLIAADGSFVDSYGAGGGLDGDDKALGKASTYSRKDAVLKLLAVPEKNMIDTDDEEEVGVSSGAAGAAERQKGDEVIAEYRAAIKTCANMVALRALGQKIKKEPESIQLALSPAYLARMQELEVK